MKIKWNKVTWYSKLMAVIVGLTVFYVGVCIGEIYESTVVCVNYGICIR